MNVQCPRGKEGGWLKLPAASCGECARCFGSKIDVVREQGTDEDRFSRATLPLSSIGQILQGSRLDLHVWIYTIDPVRCFHYIE
ncbi:MAG: hypothetical protein CVU64_05360 [Deltaproteobacteria bacterium HGW-Deltaproteobacteria-21]|nr:MAG: hypothetical protein CVU64_05360 [Deltaproteobacteria bacterium HGW-Deltaproteobacteria-21]